jgi:glycosyltransferase involved in cell wall biosynthesis
VTPTLHLVALPHTQTTNAYLSCAYTQKVVKFCRMMHGRYEVILYAGELNEAPCVEHVELVSEAERSGWFGDGFNTVLTPFKWEEDEPYWKAMNERAIKEIHARADSHDLLLLTGGWPQQPIARKTPLQALEWGVGYKGVFAKFCAFESRAWMHHVYGRQRWDIGRFYDAVIPNFFDPDDFAPAPKRDYVLFVGRLIEGKGPHVAGDVARRAGLPLVVVGPGVANFEPRRIVCSDGTKIEGDVEYLGEVGVEQRASLMAEARCLLAPTLYIEPFGGVAVEAMLSGTPALTTDWGAFPETVETGRTGFRFHTLGEADEMLQQAMELEPAGIRASAVERFSLEAVAPLYEAWFEQLDGLWGRGWYA